MLKLNFPINNQNIVDLDSYFAEPSHAILLSANSGFGVDELSIELAGLLSKDPIIVRPESKTDKSLPKITVESIRNLYTYANQKSVKRRVFCIASADLMTREAQNAFLKLLEEPLTNTNFILSSEDSSKLLPTVRSRVQTIQLKNLTDKQSLVIIEKMKISDPARLRQILFLSSGLPGEVTKLASDEKYFERRSDIIRDGRTLLMGNMYEKLLIIKKHKDDRDLAIRLVDDVLLILKNSLSTKASVDVLTQINTWIEARERLVSNGSVRLTLLSSVL